MKNLFMIFLLMVLSVSFSFAQRNGVSQENAEPFFDKVDLPYQTVYNEGGEAVLFDNGPLVTLPGGGCSGRDASILDGAVGGHTLYGWNINRAAGTGAYYYIADDFTSTSAWNIDSMKFFAYQTGATTVTINGLYVQIWNGAPNAGGTVVWGDINTNILARAGWTNIHRAQSTTPTDCSRRIQEVVGNVGVNLPAGHYWVQWGVTGTSTSGPWCPPVTIQGQAVTGDAIQKTDATTWAPALNGDTSPNGAPFIVYGNSGPPCPVGVATNPSPASGTVNVSVNSPGNATWTNGTGTTQVEVFFGPQGNLTSVYSGAAVTTLAIPTPLLYSTVYEWRVVNKNDTCSGGPVETWSFTTEADPNIVVLLEDDFTGGTANWTITNDGGTCIWEIFAAPFPNSYTVPNQAGNLLAADADDCGSSTTTLSTATLANPLNTANFNTVWLEFDSDFNALDADDDCFVDVSIDGGTNWVNVLTYDGVDVRNTHEVIDISSLAALQSSVLVRFKSVQPGYDWWWAIDNVKIWGTNPVPVELTSFAAASVDNSVTLNWTTATESNNKGFEVERKLNGTFQAVGFVEGRGTSTEVNNYSFVDSKLDAGKYSYRLKQVDYNGGYSYSNEVEVEVEVPKVFALEQNYPNPFNPSTKIVYGLAIDSKVSLKVFDVLGQEVLTLVSGQVNAGQHEVRFNAAGLNSGVYFYRIDAVGIDGSSFSSVKKMILTK